MSDEKIIELFFERSEQAICELDNKYGKLFHSLSYNILRNSEDVEECINDSYFAVWNKIPPEKPDPLLAYVCKIVRSVSIKLYNRKTAYKRNGEFDISLQEIEDCCAGLKTVESEIELKELKITIEKFLDKLSLENRVIFVRRYWFCDSYEDIAKLIGISSQNVSVKLVRIRKQLRKYLLERGY